MKLKWFSAAVLVGFFLCATNGFTLTFSDLNAGVQITINDSIPDSTYSYSASGGSESLGPAGEDNETERRDGTNTYTGNWWDFEAMYYNKDEGTLTVFAGFDLTDPYLTHQVGDLFFGQFTDNNPSGNTYSARYALDIDWNNHAYTHTTFMTTPTTAITAVLSYKMSLTSSPTQTLSV